MKNIAIIPARSGSKGLRDKNIKLLNGNPLMAYSIEAALQSGTFDTVHVSTDSEQYADIARSYGADVPFLRNVETSSDTSSSWDTVREVLAKYHNIEKSFDSFMLLQPTSPLRTAHDIKCAYKLFYDNNASSIISVCEVEHSPLWCNTLPSDNSLAGFIRSNNTAKPRQQLDKYYRINGAIYLVRIQNSSFEDTLYTDGCFAYIMDKQKSIDIDDMYDFLIAQTLLKQP